MPVPGTLISEKGADRVLFQSSLSDRGNPLGRAVPSWTLQRRLLLHRCAKSAPDLGSGAEHNGRRVYREPGALFVYQVRIVRLDRRVASG